jgi:hypothetical protein
MTIYLVNLKGCLVLRIRDPFNYRVLQTRHIKMIQSVSNIA